MKRARGMGLVPRACTAEAEGARGLGRAGTRRGGGHLVRPRPRFRRDAAKRSPSHPSHPSRPRIRRDTGLVPRSATG